MTMRKIYKVLSVVLCYLLFVTATGCSNRPNTLCMDGDDAGTSQNTNQNASTSVTSFPRNTQPKELDYTPNGIVMGNVGSGKTTLLNMVCNTSHATESNLRDSVTRELFREPVAHGAYPFRLVDTPGMNGDEEVYDHAYLLRRAYEAMPYNSIFAVVTFQHREAIMKKEFLKLTKHVRKHKDNLVLMLSFCDGIKPKNREAMKLKVAALSNNLGIKTIMYGKGSNPTDLSNAMYACMSNNSKIDIDVSDEEFFLKFKVWDPGELHQAYDDFKEISKKLLIEYMKKIQSMALEKEQDVSYTNNIIKAMGLSLGHELSRHITDFEEKYRLTMEEFNSYTTHIAISKQKIKIVDEFLQNTKGLMRWDIMNPNDIRFCIKQCPHCNQFLVKTEGCNGNTTCGDVPTAYDLDENKKAKPWYQCVVKRVNGILKIDTEALANSEILLPEKSSKTVHRFVTSQLKPGAQLGLAGCGRKFNWGTLPYLNGQTFDYVMAELNSTRAQAEKNVAVATKQEVKPKSNAEEMGITDTDFVERREAYEARIDATIKSEKEPEP